MSQLPSGKCNSDPNLSKYSKYQLQQIVTTLLHENLQLVKVNANLTTENKILSYSARKDKNNAVAGFGKISRSGITEFDKVAIYRLRTKIKNKIASNIIPFLIFSSHFDPSKNLPRNWSLDFKLNSWRFLPERRLRIKDLDELMFVVFSCKKSTLEDWTEESKKLEEEHLAKPTLSSSLLFEKINSLVELRYNSKSPDSTPETILS